nr:hypothetical protein [Candidatus Sigynarchaeota archaeon]
MVDESIDDERNPFGLASFKSLAAGLGLSADLLAKILTTDDLDGLMKSLPQDKRDLIIHGLGLVEEHAEKDVERNEDNR